MYRTVFEVVPSLVRSKGKIDELESGIVAAVKQNLLGLCEWMYFFRISTRLNVNREALTFSILARKYLN